MWSIKYTLVFNNWLQLFLRFNLNSTFFQLLETKDFPTVVSLPLR